MKKSFTQSAWIRASWIFALLLSIQASIVGQTSHAVDVSNNIYTPADLTINTGDTVIWTNSEGRHNVNGMQSTYPSNPESFGNSVGFDWVFSHIFTIPGVYDYQCDPHVGLGMVGTVTVLDPGPETLTLNFTGMTPHVGQAGFIRIYDRDTKEEIVRSRTTIEETFSVVYTGIVTGHSYVIEIFSDHNGNGYYDAPPTDHAWNLELNDVDGNEVIDFAHNTSFVDIEWEHRAIVNLSGMTPHLNQEIYFALIDTESGEVLDRVSELVQESFTVELGELRPGRAYRLDFFSDHNGNGFYDPPPTDHAWRHEIPVAAGDDTLNFVHNTDFEDINWKHRLKIRFNGMTPHIGQMLTLFVKDALTLEPVDTVIVEEIPDAVFEVNSFSLVPGEDYVADFYADHNGNGSYDAPPTDHAWRLEAGTSAGDIDLEFTHNTNFTDIQPSSGPDIRLTEHGQLGQILTDASGYTLYYFTKDALPDTSLCTGDCLSNWPLFYVENPELAEGLDIADFGAIEHPEGGMQTTYKGWPLYYWIGDLNPGETNGEAVGNVWFVAKPDYSIMLMDGLLIGKDGVIYNSMYEPGEEMVQYFVDEYGRTLYIFIDDTFEKNNFTLEDLSNNSVWPVYDVVLQAVASLLDKSLFGSIDVFGHQQLTYKGWPLYYFGGDSFRGDATGVSVPGPGVWPVAVQDLETAPQATSVNDPAMESGIQIFPNPATQYLNIISVENIESVSLINLVGATIKTISDIQSSNYVLSLEGLKPGLYFVQVRSSQNQQHTGKLIKR